MRLALEGLSVGYHGTRGAVLENLHLTLSAGAFVCVLGRNGAGKSTLMRTIAGLQSALAGRVLLDGQSVAAMRAPDRARAISVVLTERNHSPGLTVQDVIELGRQPFTNWYGALSKQDCDAMDRALILTGASAFLNRRFDDLSDGERQRILIARALAQTPKLMVLDEITAFLDLPGRVEVMTLLRRHAHESGTIVLLSSHDLDLSLQLADSVWLLDGGGRLRADTPDALVGQGCIGTAFDTEEVRFSAERRRFELSSRRIQL